ncbi:MAG: DUF4291 domain-containing protein [Williamsia sp.]|nr:DUF4291 domain-containing protein [Williamsia sp.]
MEERVIRAHYDEHTITVYQAYNNAIARSAVKNQTFVSPPFKKERMTWIKPSFLWMMYRAGWATKGNQENILAVKLKRAGFEWALQQACLSHFEKAFYASYEVWQKKLQESPVRIQWDPEKDIFLQPLPYRSIQIGLSGTAVDSYVSDWIVQIEDMTALSRQIHQLVKENKIDEARNLLPEEKLYPLRDEIARHVHAG